MVKTYRDVAINQMIATTEEANESRDRLVGGPADIDERGD